MAGWGLSLMETAKKINLPLSTFKQNLKLEHFKQVWDSARRSLPNAVESVSDTAEEHFIASQTRVIEKDLLETPPEKFKERPKKKHGITLNSLEITAERQPDIWGVAKYHGISVRELNMMMRRDEEYQEAYNRGRNARKLSANKEVKTINKEEKIMPQAQKAPASRAKKGIVYSETMFEDFGQRKLIQAEIAKELGVSGSTVYYQLLKPELRKAYKKGLKWKPLPVPENLPQKPEPVEPTQEIADGIIVNQLPTADFDPIESVEKEFSKFAEDSFSNEEEKEAIPAEKYEGFPDAAPQKVEAQLVGSNRHTEILERLEAKAPRIPTYVDFKPIDSIPSTPSTVVELGNGSIAVISLMDFNPFKADLKSRHFIESLVNLVQEFQEN